MDAVQLNHVEMRKRSSTSAPLRLVLLILLLVIVVLVLVIITLVVSARGLSDLDTKVTQVKDGLDGLGVSNKATRPCSTAECVQLSGEILSRMDATVDPCQDFYQYACGGFINDPLTPQDVKKWATTSIMDKTNKFIVKRLLGDDKPADEDSEAITKAKRFYASCLNVTMNEVQDIQPVLQMIQDIGGWPLGTPGGTAWTEAGWGLEESLAAVHRRGVHAIFLEYVSEDNKNNSLHRLVFNQANTFLPDATFYTGPRAAKNKAALTSLLTSMVDLLGGNVTAARIIANDVWALDKAIADIKLTLVNYRADVRKRYNLMTLRELQTLMDNSLDLGSFLQHLFGYSIPMSETIIIRVPTVYAKMGSVLKNAHKSTLSTYMVLLALWELAPSASMSLRRAVEDFEKATAGGSHKMPDWQSCIADTVEAMGFAVGTLFTREHFTASDKQEVVELLENIRTTFLTSIPTLPWMDDATKLSAREKAQRVVHKMGFPDFIHKPDLLDEYYRTLKVTDNHFLNRMRSFTALTKNNLQKLGSPVDKEVWSEHTSPTIVNAFYDPQENSMIFPAGILQKPMYHGTYPRALSYGAIGTIMGHELTHGFDTTGRRYDKHGNLFNWWANSSAEEFETRTKCLITQYDNYDLEGNQISGELTLGENIADNGGLRLSYRAYHTWLNDHGNRDKLLTGLELDYSQMFFLGFAQTLCSSYKPEFIPLLVRKDVHSPAKFRVVGTMSNMGEFAKAFQCPRGSPMNPTDKCEIWT